MGKMQRRKGTRGEYLFRDIVRSFGYVADRVPLSGSAQGFPGDVRFSKEGKTFTAEIKLRKNNFQRIYTLYDKFKNLDYLALSIEGNLIGMSYDFPVAMAITGAMSITGCYLPPEEFEGWKPYVRTFSKILNLKKLLGGCDVLAIKDDHRPFLYIRYR